MIENSVYLAIDVSSEMVWVIDVSSEMVWVINLGIKKRTWEETREGREHGRRQGKEENMGGDKGSCLP